MLSLVNTSSSLLLVSVMHLASINEQKSSLYFSANIKAEQKDEVKRILGISERDPKAKYLGLPTEWGRSKKESMGFVTDKVTGKTQGWGDK